MADREDLRAFGAPGGQSLGRAMTGDVAPEKLERAGGFSFGSRPRALAQQAAHAAAPGLYRTLGPRAAATLLARRAEFPRQTKAGPHVLCLNRAFFARDLEQMERRTALNLIRLPAALLGAFQRAFIPAPAAVQSEFMRFMGPANSAMWDEAERFADLLLAALARRGPLDAVLTANVDYWQDEGLRRACRRAGVPFLVLSREHVCTQRAYDWYLEYLVDYRFSGDGVAVFGEWTARALVDSGAVPADIISVTGAPRLDVWRDATARRPRRTAVLISFRDAGYYSPQAFAATLQAFAAASSRAGPDAEFIVKARDPEDIVALEAMLAPLPAHRVQVTNAEPVDVLLRRAALMIAHNSLSMIEGFASGAPVLAPAFADAIDEQTSIFRPDVPAHRSAVRFVQSPDELEHAIIAALDGALGWEPRAEEALQQIVHIPADVTASELAARFIMDHIAARRRGAA